MFGLRNTVHKALSITWSTSMARIHTSLNLNSASSMDAVGFVGLGHMGSRMALNLARAGYTVHVYDISDNRVSEFQKRVASEIGNRVNACTSLEQLAGCNAPQTIITMLPSSPHSCQVYGKESGSGLVAHCKQGTSFIDCTTGDPHVAKDIAKYAWSKQCSFIDAPVSGGVAAAEAGTLTFMVGGVEEAISHVTPLLHSMGKKIFHCGPVGSGLAAKLCNNMLLAISMVGLSEAMELGRRLGLDPKLLASVINSSSGRCWSSEVYNPVPGVLDNVPASKNYSGGFRAHLLTKDLDLAQHASTTTKCPTPLGSLAHQLYQNMCQHGFGERDFSYIFQYLSQSL